MPIYVKAIFRIYQEMFNKISEKSSISKRSNFQQDLLPTMNKGTEVLISILTIK